MGGTSAKLEAEKVSAGLDALGRCSAALTGDHYRTLEAIKQLEASSMIHLKASLIWHNLRGGGQQGPDLDPTSGQVCAWLCNQRSCKPFRGQNSPIDFVFVYF